MADFIWEWVADIKSESVAGFISEALADIARNQHALLGWIVVGTFARLFQ